MDQAIIFTHGFSCEFQYVWFVFGCRTLFCKKIPKHFLRPLEFPLVQGGGTGESEVRTSCTADRARFGDGRGRVQEEDCVGPGGVDVLSAGAQGSRAGEGKALDHCR